MTNSSPMTDSRREAFQRELDESKYHVICIVINISTPVWCKSSSLLCSRTTTQGYKIMDKKLLPLLCYHISNCSQICFFSDIGGPSASRVSCVDCRVNREILSSQNPFTTPSPRRAVTQSKSFFSVVLIAPSRQMGNLWISIFQHS